MALFGTQEETKKSGKASAKKAKVAESDATMAYQIIVKPRVTEKSHAVLGLNKYVFDVRPVATKTSIKRALERAYGVTVEDVNIIRIPSKKRVFGRNIGRKSGIKKAVVTLKEGDSIEFFQGA